MEIIVKTQADLDKIKVEDKVEIKIEGGVWENRIIISKSYYYRVVARGNSNVEAWGNSGIHLLSEFATVVLWAFSVCWKCGKSYEEWVNPNFCEGCRAAEFNIKRKDFKH